MLPWKSRVLEVGFHTYAVGNHSFRTFAIWRGGRSNFIEICLWTVLKKLGEVQLNLHEIDLLFRYLNHHLTWHCSSISEDLHWFARNLQHWNAKLFFVIVSEQYAPHMLQISCKSVQIFRNPETIDTRPGCRLNWCVRITYKVQVYCILDMILNRYIATSDTYQITLCILLRQAIFEKIRKIKKTGYIFTYQGCIHRGDRSHLNFQIHELYPNHMGGSRFWPPSQMSHLNFSSSYVPACYMKVEI